MTNLEFGPPKDFLQAMIRLPERNHLLYKSDQVIEHLTHIGERLSELLVLSVLEPEELENLPLEGRLIPVNLEDLAYLERISFRRNPAPVINAEHEYLEKGSVWGDFYFQDSNDYGWWDVHSMSPNLEIPGHELACIMFNKYTGGESFPPQRGRLNPENWDIEIGVVKSSEISLLASLLSRRNTP